MKTRNFELRLLTLRYILTLQDIADKHSKLSIRISEVKVKQIASLIGMMVLGMGFVPQANAQRPSDVGAWYQQFTTIGLDDHWSFHLENQYRAYDATDLEQSLNRIGLNYYFPDLSLTVTQGYGFIYTDRIVGPTSDDRVSIDEHRTYQQLMYKHDLGSWKITHRGRFEERWFGDDVDLRTRYFIGGDLPLDGGGRMDPGTPYLSLSNELFTNLQGKAFDRDRVYGGVGYVLNESCRVQLGFLRQILPDVSASQNFVTLSFYFNL